MINAVMDEECQAPDGCSRVHCQVLVSRCHKSLKRWLPSHLSVEVIRMPSGHDFDSHAHSLVM